MRKQTNRLFTAERPSHTILIVITAMLTVGVLSGCGSKITTGKELVAFEQAGRAEGVQNIFSVPALPPESDYKLSPEDVLEVQLPVQAVVPTQTAAVGVQAVACRVGRDGSLRLPTVGALPASGKTISQLEHDVATAYYPKYLRTEPVVVARVTESHTVSVTVAGSVRSPGIFALKSNEMSLGTLLAKAGGVGPEGIRRIEIRRAGSQPVTVTSKTVSPESIVLRENDVVQVTGGAPRVFTVLGQVRNPGVFPYPENADYMLSNAMAVAGGVNLNSQAQFITIYRKDASGRTLTRRCKIEQDPKVGQLPCMIRPGDVLQVETNLVYEIYQAISKFFGVGAGATYSLN